jgi:hypothetical protein
LRIGGEAKRSHISGTSGSAGEPSRIGIVERGAGADVQRAAGVREWLQRVDVADVDDVGELAQLLRDPQADVGVAGEDRRLRMLGAQRRAARQRTRREERAAGVLVDERVAARDRAELVAHGARSNATCGRSNILHARLDDRLVAGAATEVAGQRVAHVRSVGRVCAQV